jgi:hypothetical protein
MKKIGILATMMFIFLFLASSAFASPLIGHWSWMAFDCDGDVDFQDDGTGNLFLACFDDTNQCWDVSPSNPFTWQKVARGVYQTDFFNLILNGNIAFSDFGINLIKNVNIDDLKPTFTPVCP